MNEMLPLDGRYERMVAAIADCHSVDECKETANRAEALAIYARQIHDDASLKQYLEIKIRAWRRIGELLCEVAGIEPKVRDTSFGSIKAPSVSSDMLRAMRRSFTCELTDLEIRRAVAVASIDGDFFEQHAESGKSPYHFFDAYCQFCEDEWLKTPEGQEYTHAETEELERRRLSFVKMADLPPYSGELKPGPDTVTIDIVVSKQLYEMLRDVAHERRLTQQYILRTALVEWFIKEDFDPPEE